MWVITKKRKSCLLTVFSNLLFLVSILEFLITQTETKSTDPIASTTQGKLAGRIAYSRSGRKYAEFLGIPYARIPQTFMPALAAKKWEGVRDATKFGPRCLQFDRKSKQILGNEQCLYMNIYRAGESEIALPVMVYFHGGANTFGSSDSYKPQYFMDHDVILITFNFRLGVLGFLNTGDSVYPANLGMKDQVIALRWIRDNIVNFGGDPSRVTIFGDSSGGAAVSYHILSPMSRGLFSSAISQSGHAICPWAFVPNPKTVSKRIGTSLGCPTTNSRHLMACLMNKEAKDIIMAQQDLSGWDDDPIVPFAPSIETTISSTPPGTVFLPDHPYKMLSSGIINKVPWITGVNNLEGATLYSAIILNSTELTQEFNRNWNRMAPFALGFKDTPHHHNEAAMKIREFYFQNKSVSVENRDNLTDMFSDRNFFQCNKEAALLHAKHNAPVYLYYFTHEGELSWLDLFGVPKKLGYKGVVHSDELQFQFNIDPFPELKNGTKNGDFSTKFVGLWVSFATNKKPTKTWGSVKEWNPIQPGEITGQIPLKYYQIDVKAKIITEPFTERLDFWKSLPINITNYDPV